MKRIISLAVGGAMLLGTVCAAGAVEIKPKAQWDFSFGWVENHNYGLQTLNTGFTSTGNGGANRDNFEARQRARIGADMIISEQLSATVYFEIGDISWGRNGTNPGQAGGGLGSDGINMKTKHAYLDWMIPGTKAQVRMGLQTLGLPHFTSANPIFNHDVAAIAITAPITDQVSVAAFWARPFDVAQIDAGTNIDDEVDMFGVIVPITLDGAKISPYAAFAAIGNGSGIGENWIDGNGATPQGSAYGWLAGLAFQLSMFDPLTFSFNGVYSTVDGASSAAEWSRGWNPDVSGWFIDASLNYKLDFATAGLFGWYGTGDDAEDAANGQSGRAAAFGNDTGFGYTSFGQFSRMNRTAISNDRAVSNTSLGTWGVGVELANMTFVEDLTHTIRLAYYEGTNDNDLIGSGFRILQSNEGVYMTTDDSAWEINFDHQYKIYENLTAFLDLGYIKLDMDEDWGNDYMDDAAWRAMVSFQFKF